MKNLKSSTLLILASAMLLASCSGMRQMVKNADDIQLQVTPSVLEVHGDSIEVQIDGRIPERYLRKKATLGFEPTLYFGDDAYPLRGYKIRGEDVSTEDIEDDDVPVIEFRPGGRFSVTEKVPYQAGMRRSHLCMTLNIRIKSKYEELQMCASPFYDTLAIGTIATSQLVANDDILQMGGSLDPQRVNKDAVIHFEINRHEVRRSERQGDKMKSVREFTKTPMLEINGVSIHSYASPDGEVDFNERLAENRTSSTYRYLTSELKSLGFDAVHDTAFKRESTKEDWAGFRRAVERSDMPNKNEVLRIIDSESDALSRETRLKQDEERWEYLAEHIFPPLRRSDFTLHSYIKLRDIDEVLAIGSEDMSKLNKRELLNFAHHSEDREVKYAAHKHFKERFTDSWFGHNNYGMLLLEEGKVDEAIPYFEKAIEMDENAAAAHNNIGVAYRLKKDYRNAMTHLRKAADLGVDAGHNLGNLYLNLGDYARANESYASDACAHNAALAELMAGNNDAAMEKIQCVVDKTAEDYYLRAVIAARKGDRELMTTSLTRAIELDSDYRGKAQDDLEFRDSWNTPQFESAIN